MSSSSWDKKFEALLQRAGQELQRVATDVKKEADHLIAQANDPERQRQLKERLKDAEQFARKAADEAAVMVEEGLKRAEAAFRDVMQVPPPSNGGPADPSSDKASAPISTPTSAAPSVDKSNETAKPGPVEKTLGRPPGENGQ